MGLRRKRDQRTAVVCAKKGVLGGCMVYSEAAEEMEEELKDDDG